MPIPVNTSGAHRVGLRVPFGPHVGQLRDIVLVFSDLAQQVFERVHEEAIRIRPVELEQTAAEERGRGAHDEGHLVEALVASSVRLSVVEACAEVLKRRKSPPYLRVRSERPSADLEGRELVHSCVCRRHKLSGLTSRCQRCPNAERDGAHSAAMMMGKGRLALPRAGTTLGSDENVRFGELSRWY